MSNAEETVRNEIFDFQFENGEEIKALEEMTVEEALFQYLHWNGIFGYDIYILAIFDFYKDKK